MAPGADSFPALAGWESFYVITGSSAAGLIGLMFVVVSLVTEANAGGDPDTINAFATPSVVQFGAVLLIAAILSTPGQTATSLAICIAICATIGLMYSVRVIARAMLQEQYEPELSDWIWYIALPPFAYIVLLAAAVVLRIHAGVGLYLIGAIDLMLLFIGMHNAWDTATFVALRKRQANAPKP